MTFKTTIIEANKHLPTLEKVDVYIVNSEKLLNGNVEVAIELAQEANRLAQEVLYTKGMAESLKLLAMGYQNLTNYSDAMRYAIEARELFQTIKDLKGEAACLNILGGVYNFLGDLTKRLECNKECLNLRKQINNQTAVLSSLNNIGDTYLSMKDYENALLYFFKCLSFKGLADDILAIVKCNIAETYLYQKEYDLTVKFVDEGLDHAIACNYYQIIIAAYILKSKVAAIKNKYDLSLNYLVEAEKVFEKRTDKEQQYEIYELYSHLYQKLGNFEKAYAYLSEHNKLKNAVLNENNAQKMKKIEFDFQLKSITDEAQQIKDKNKLLNKAFKQIEHQSNEIKEKNRAITDSIHYAKRIQYAILPEDNYVKRCLEKSFVFYQPKDIVSGDFYWVEQIGDNVVFCVVDCTGHGVPGAFVSLIANNALNKVVLENGVTEPGAIINALNIIITDLFKRSGESIRDGMDIGVCCLNKKHNSLDFSGAFNSLFIVSNGMLKEIKGNRESVGASIFKRKKNFINHKVELKKGDRVYLSSDGYPDQFGGEKGRKLKWSGFRNVLVNASKLPITEQKNEIERFFNNWKKDIEQLDDVCVMGVEI